MELKRAFDIAASGAGIALCALPVMAAALAISTETGSSLFHTQMRVGLNGRLFRIFKIKSMSDATGPDGRPLPDDRRTGPLGIFLRKSRIDELPQLLNVFMGDMSIVGPRPIVPYQELAKDAKRHLVRPGLTGPSQVAGKNGLSMERILELDHGYVDNHSFWGDLKLIVQTPLSLVRNRRLPHYFRGAQACNAPETPRPDNGPVI